MKFIKDNMKEEKLDLFKNIILKTSNKFLRR